MTKIQLSQVSEDVRNLNPHLFEPDTTDKPNTIEGIVPVYRQWEDDVIGNEDAEQESLVIWLDWLADDPNWHQHSWFFHPANGGARTGRAGSTMKKLGVKKGVPDLMNPSLKWAVEMKVKPNRATTEQKEWLEHLATHGWHVAICYSKRDAQQFLMDVFGIPEELI